MSNGTSTNPLVWGLIAWSFVLSVPACKDTSFPESEQADYCTYLQPQLDSTARQAKLPLDLRCLSVPGMAELGDFNVVGALREDNLAPCFHEQSTFNELVTDGRSINLAVKRSFQSTIEGGAAVGLQALVPWLPRIEAHSAESSEVTAVVTLVGAKFQTFTGFSEAWQRFAKRDCLRVLCDKGPYEYVGSSIQATISARVEFKKRSSKDATLSWGSESVPAEASGSIVLRTSEDGALELSSGDEPVTIAVSRSRFLSPLQAERCTPCGATEERCCDVQPSCSGRGVCVNAACADCGALDEPCCDETKACDDGMYCNGGQCAKSGVNGTPCDQGVCEAGSACVSEYCRAGCGGAGQACCDGVCEGVLKCAPQPETVRVSRQRKSISANLFGFAQDHIFGPSKCPAGYERATPEVRKLRGGGGTNCAMFSWVAPRDPHDCRLKVHFGGASLQSITCEVDIRATRPVDRCTEQARPSGSAPQAK